MQHLLGYVVQMPAGISEQQQQQLQQQQQESGTRVVDGQLVLQAQSEPVTSSTGDHASQGNPAAWDKQAQQAQQAQREAPQNVEACFHGAPTQPETAVLPAAVADADNKSQVNKCFAEHGIGNPVEHKRRCSPAQAITSAVSENLIEPIQLSFVGWI